MTSPTLQNKSNKALRTIGEVAELLEIPAHVIRFWETKFDNINPSKYNGRRYYSLQNIETLKKIQELLYQENHTIAEAVTKLSAKPSKNINKSIKMEIEPEILAESNLLSQQLSLFQEAKPQEYQSFQDFSILENAKNNLLKAKEKLTQII